MHWPYTLDFADSFMAAQLGAALMFTAVLFFWRIPRVPQAMLLAGIWLSAVAPLVGSPATDLGFTPRTDAFGNVLLLAASLGTLAAVLASRRRVAIVALLGQVPLWWLTGFIKESDGELAALHMAWLGLIVGVLGRRAPPPPTDAPAPDTEESYLAHDLVALVVSTLLAALVCTYVLDKRDGSADEWAYTYQAAVFAKGHIYATTPPCQHYLESFYVFESAGRLFSQYTPGWPLFLAPFFKAGAVWMAAPVSMGLMAGGMARLGRSAMRGAFTATDGPPSARIIRLAGTWAAVLSSLGTSLLTNAASRYPHVYVLALYAWSLEALVQVVTPGLSRRRQVLWGLVLGSASLHDVAVRPADGAFMGIGLAAIFVYALVKRRVGRNALAWAVGSFGFWALIVLVILRLQIGKWFTTGYSLNAIIHPWNGVKFTVPGPHQWKYGLPLATGAYCWWPSSVPLGLAGLARMRGRAGELVVAMLSSCLPYIIFCAFLDLDQRGVDWGYGPRYLMVLVVPSAIGGAVVLAPLTAHALGRVAAGPTALSRRAPLALAIFAVASAWLRIAPSEWATVTEHTRKHSSLTRALGAAHLKNAIVLAADDTTGFSELDLTTNLPPDLYPEEEVIIAIDRKTPEEAAACLVAAFPGRRLYHASAGEEVQIYPAN